jgi:hypothetical protein
VTPFIPLAVRSATPADFVGITGRLQSEQVVGFDRNQRLTSSESALCCLVARIQLTIDCIVQFVGDRPR